MFSDLQVNVRVRKVGRVQHAVKSVCQVIMAGGVKMNARVKMEAHVIISWESVHVSRVGEENAVISVSFD